MPQSDNIKLAMEIISTRRGYVTDFVVKMQLIRVEMYLLTQWRDELAKEAKDK